jgi:hypothetical protein
MVKHRLSDNVGPCQALLSALRFGGQPHMTITYSLSDLPTDAQKQVEAGIK